MKSILEEVAGYRLKVERDGKEIINVPGILALPGVLIAPKMSLVGTVAASLLGCNIHLENEEGKTVDVGGEVKKAAETVAEAAEETARSIKAGIDRVWDDLSADDPEGCPEGEENAEEAQPEEAQPAEEAQEAEEAQKAEEAQPAESGETPEACNEDILQELQNREDDGVPTIRIDPEDAGKE